MQMVLIGEHASNAYRAGDTPSSVVGDSYQGPNSMGQDERSVCSSGSSRSKRRTKRPP